MRRYSGNLTTSIQLRMTPQQFGFVANLARTSGVTMSEILRSMIDARRAALLTEERAKGGNL